MPDGHCADPSLPLHLDQGRSSSKKESFSLRVSPALHPPERPSPRRVDMAGHGHGSGDAGTETYRQDCNVDVVVDDIDCLRDKIKSSMIGRLHLRHYPRIDSNIPMSNASSSLSPLHIQGNPGILMYQIRGGGVDAPGSIQPLNDLHLIVCLRV